MTRKSSLVGKHKDVLSGICKLKNKQRSEFIKRLPGEILNAITEIFKNFLSKNISVGSQLIKKYKRHRDAIRRVSLKSTPQKEKRKFLSSRIGGNILGALIPLAISAITSIFK